MPKCTRQQTCTAVKRLSNTLSTKVILQSQLRAAKRIQELTGICTGGLAGMMIKLMSAHVYTYVCIHSCIHGCDANHACKIARPRLQTIELISTGTCYCLIQTAQDLEELQQHQCMCSLRPLNKHSCNRRAHGAKPLCGAAASGVIPQGPLVLRQQQAAYACRLHHHQ